MRRLEPARFSGAYRVRLLEEEDIPAVLELYRTNPLFFGSSGQNPGMEQVRRDMTVMPPGVGAGRKYFVGFYEGKMLAAVLDLIDGYPTRDTAYIGLFMVSGPLSGEGRGTALVESLWDYLRQTGISVLRLAYDRENPQSSHFWRKNGFRPIYDTSHPDYGELTVAERT